MLLATPAIAQESSRTDFEEFCKAMQGRWVGDVTWVTDWPGVGKKGDRVKCYVETKPIADGQALLGRFFGGSGSATWITVYDAASKKIRETVVDSGGTMWTSVIHKDDGKWIVIQTGSTGDGRKIKGKDILTISDDGNKHSYSGSTTIGGEAADELQDVWIRVSDQ